MLLGCRRRKGVLSIEVWDTGIGIPEKDYRAIFGEYHQLDNAARERSRGLGLGLSIVQRLGQLLGHQVAGPLRTGKGSVFTIDVVVAAERKCTSARTSTCAGMMIEMAEPGHRTGEILVVEDDPEMRELLELLLKDEGHHMATAPDGITAQAMLQRGAIRPDLVLTDYNLPNGLNGLQFAEKLREKLHAQIPVIILTGDISTETLRDIALQNCVQLSKPVKCEGADARHPERTTGIAICRHSHHWNLKEPTAGKFGASNLRRGRRRQNTRRNSQRARGRWSDGRRLCVLRRLP